jgi:hypothetical protein
MGCQVCHDYGDVASFNKLMAYLDSSALLQKGIDKFAANLPEADV